MEVRFNCHFNSFLGQENYVYGQCADIKKIKWIKWFLSRLLQETKIIKSNIQITNHKVQYSETPQLWDLMGVQGREAKSGKQVGLLFRACFCFCAVSVTSNQTYILLLDKKNQSHVAQFSYRIRE